MKFERRKETGHDILWDGKNIKECSWRRGSERLKVVKRGAHKNKTRKRHRARTAEDVCYLGICYLAENHVMITIQSCILFCEYSVKWN